MTIYQPRTYRRYVNTPGMVSYAVVEKETDLYISTATDLSREAREVVRRLRRELEAYIAGVPFFAVSLEPVEVAEDAPPIVKEMARAAGLAGVGPMAAVAGAIAQSVGEELNRLSPDVIVENGGDVYIKSSRSRTVGILAGDSPISGRLGLEITPGDTPVGICTSSSTVGPSLSFGRTDAAVAVAPSTALADAAATAIGNAVGSPEDIGRGLKVAENITGLTGAVIIIDGKIGLWGKLQPRSLEIL